MRAVRQAVLVAVVTLGGGAATVAAMNRDVPDFAVPAAPWAAGEALDGRSFRVTGKIAETGEVLPETVLSFADGRFQSSRCQIYCEFGWQEYRTWSEGEVVHFTATTRCPDAPHTVVWHGAVTGEAAMRVEGSWTTRRWYWTQQVNLLGEGVPVAAAAAPTPAASGG